jgi:hypothetical protein
VRPCCSDLSLTAVYGNNCRCFEYSERCINSLHCVEKLGTFIVETMRVITAEFYRIGFFDINLTHRDRFSSSNSVLNFIINTNLKLFTA